MEAVGQNIAISATLLFLATMILRQVPFLGFFVRLATRVLLLFSPIVIIVLLVGIVWFHGASWLQGGVDTRSTANRAAAPAATGAASIYSPIHAPMPTERPID